MDRALEKVRDDLVPKLTREIRATFRGALFVVVYDAHWGYTCDQEHRIVLGVEVRSKDSCRSHILKIGSAQEVANDFRGWQKCMLKRNFSSRIFVSVSRKKLRRNRFAIVYQDAYTLYGPDEVAVPLEDVTRWAIMDDKPDPASVQRVIRQTYSELARWFYAGSRPHATGALRHYERRLSRALPKWVSEEERIELRQDLAWLLYCQGIACPDPYDYVCWALERKRLPQTLVGRSHGDLHARNVLVGVQHGEAQFPAVFDYGDMDEQNVLVWDFVKLETELKVRFLERLYQDDAARRALVAKFRERRQRDGWPPDRRPSPTAGLRAIRADRLAFALAFELLLAERTTWIGGVDEACSPSPSWSQAITVDPKVDRALAILLQIRQQAAYWLGERQPQRGSRRLWRDEYYFALTVYGLCTSKFDYTPYETEFALVSAVIGAAQIQMARADLRAALLAKPVLPSRRPPRIRHPYPCYRVPLTHAHALWTAKRTRANVQRAVEILSDAVTHFPHAVPLLQEYALALAEAGQDVKAEKALRGVKEFCAVFRDEETLCRIGRTHKDLGDRALERHPVPLGRMKDSPGYQHYKTAYGIYKEAFDIRQYYYPGINAATLAFLIGNRGDARRLAKAVLTQCGELDVSQEEPAWVFLSEGEASLLLGERRKAASFYDRALSLLSADQGGYAQSAYNQVCRLWWALGGRTVQPVLAVFKRCHFELERGPLGNCGLRNAPGARRPARRKRPAGKPRAKSLRKGGLPAAPSTKPHPPSTRRPVRKPSK
ncbi:MAG: hypothetical protein FJ290_20620 [Planctomycetes bacterium]|nr:hypothetical protein [Planctomycetota bacterium]